MGYPAGDLETQFTPFADNMGLDDEFDMSTLPNLEAILSQPLATIELPPQLQLPSFISSKTQPTDPPQPPYPSYHRTSSNLLHFSPEPPTVTPLSPPSIHPQSSHLTPLSHDQTLPTSSNPHPEQPANSPPPTLFVDNADKETAARHRNTLAARRYRKNKRNKMAAPGAIEGLKNAVKAMEERLKAVEEENATLKNANTTLKDANTNLKDMNTNLKDMSVSMKNLNTKLIRGTAARVKLDAILVDYLKQLTNVSMNAVLTRRAVIKAFYAEKEILIDKTKVLDDPENSPTTLKLQVGMLRDSNLENHRVLAALFKHIKTDNSGEKVVEVLKNVVRINPKKYEAVAREIAKAVREMQE